MTRERVVAAAQGWIGTPYQHQAARRGAGCDCLGLVRGVFAEVCGRPAEAPPPYSRDWAEAFASETMLEAARRHLREIAVADAGAGDVLIFRMRAGAMAKHAAILSALNDDPGSCKPGSALFLSEERFPPEDRVTLFGNRSSRMIHACEGAPVCEVSLGPWWRRRIAGAFRFPDLED
ncbi:MAG: NlpC/P60 family protein [Hyphomicrobiales bacterium]|nr:NlpC/P60 family protein [Hyphomicrobiales bacterium]